MTALEFRNVRFAYPNSPQSLDGVTFSIQRGSKVALVGPNGAGKTTLLLMCNGILEPSSGTVFFNGIPLGYDRTTLREIRKKIGLVFQNSDTQLFAPSVYQDVAFGPVNLGMDPAAVKRCVSEALRAVGLSGYERRSPHQLSGGEKKRVAIAGVLAMDPEILIFDEPTSALDPAGASELMELLDELNANGTTIIISTHDVELAYQWADEILLISRGRILSRGHPGTVFTDPVLVAKSNLRTPPILDLHAELVSRQILPSGMPPKSTLHMVDAIEDAFSRENRAVQTGTITVGNVDVVSDMVISNWVDRHPEARIGAMGTRSKERAEMMHITPDFTYGVIDKCILKAIIGKPALILTTDSMVQRVMQRVGEYCCESKKTIPLILLDNFPDELSDTGGKP